MELDPNLLKILAILSRLTEQEVGRTLMTLTEQDPAVRSLVEEVRPATWRLILLVERLRDATRPV